MTTLCSTVSFGSKYCNAKFQSFLSNSRVIRNYLKRKDEYKENGRHVTSKWEYLMPKDGNKRWKIDWGLDGWNSWSLFDEYLEIGNFYSSFQKIFIIILAFPNMRTGLTYGSGFKVPKMWTATIYPQLVI